MTGLGFLELRLRGMTPRFDGGNCDEKMAEMGRFKGALRVGE
jgi:hypothetical protein